MKETAKYRLHHGKYCTVHGTLEFAVRPKLGMKENLSAPLAENKMGGAISYFSAPFTPPSEDGWREETAKYQGN